MGLHTAEPFLDGTGYFGLGVHRAARICAAAHGGQILVSNATAGIVEDLESIEFELRDLGEYRLKDIVRPQRLFELRVQGLEREFAPPKAHDDGTARDPYGRIGTLLGSDMLDFSRRLRELGDDVTARSRRTTANSFGSPSKLTAERRSRPWPITSSRSSNALEMQSSAPHRREPSSGSARGQRVRP